MIAQQLQNRNLPDLMHRNSGEAVTPDNWAERKKELIDSLSENLFGYTPAAPKEIRVSKTGNYRYHAFAGKAVAERFDLTFDTPTGDFTFPFEVVVPCNVQKPPVILYMSLNDMYPFPWEEILDNGFAVATFNYEHVQPDGDKAENYFAVFKGGLGEKYFCGQKREKTQFGKVGIWAYAASRVMDYLQTREDINKDRIAIAGHSRLGKTALWCRAQDSRFYMAFGNNTNYGGGGLIRGHIGEDVPDFTKKGSYDFFCEGWKDYENVPHDQLPFDQHFLMACQAPGYVYLTGSTKDPGMDTTSEFLSCHAASCVYKMLGKQGIVSDEEPPVPGQPLHEGEIGFHIREGGHFLSREDWLHFMAYFKKHL